MAKTNVQPMAAPIRRKGPTHASVESVSGIAWFGVLILLMVR